MDEAEVPQNAEENEDLTSKFKFLKRKSKKMETNNVKNEK